MITNQKTDIVDEYGFCSVHQEYQCECYRPSLSRFEKWVNSPEGQEHIQQGFKEANETIAKLKEERKVSVDDLRMPLDAPLRK